MGRRTVLLIAAIVVAALGTTLIFAYVSRTDERAREDQELVRVLVAKSLIRQGTTGAAAQRAGAFEFAEVPKSVQLDGGVAAVADISELVAATDIHPNEQIISAKFVVPGTAGLLPIPSGKVAMSVQLGDPQRVAGFVQPGNDVAIFVTIAQVPVVGQPPPTGPATRLLLPRVSVLAIGATTLRPAGSGDQNKESVPTAIVTLAVDQAQAQKLIFASQNGALYFTLLTKDSKVAPGPGIDLRSLFS